MEDRIVLLEERVAALEVSLGKLEARLGRDAEAPPPVAVRAPAREAEDEEAPVLRDAGGLVALLGRGFMGLAGAFLIRAVTDSGALPHAAGVALGLAYAGAWAFLADRAAAAGPSRAATANGLLAVLVGFPLVVETSTRLGVLSPAASAAVLLGLSVLLVWVAWRRDLPALAWATTLAVVASALALLVATRAAETFAALLVVVGAASLWLTYGRRWHGLRWPPALGADLAVLVLCLLAGWAGGPPEQWRGLSPGAAAFLGLALVVVYPGSFAVRTVWRQRRVNPFELVQATLALLAGFGGAVRVALATGTGVTVLGAAALALGLGGYAVAFAFVERRPERGLNFVFFTSVAFLLTLAGSGLALGSRGVLAWCLLGIAAAVLGGRFARTSLEVHAALFLGSAALAAGLPGPALDAWHARGVSPWRPLSVAGLGGAFAAGAAWLAIGLLRRDASMPARLRVPGFVLALVSFSGLSAAVLHALARLLGGEPAGPGAVAAARTAVVAVAAVALAALARRPGLSEAGWLVWPLLGWGALKLVIEDIPAGRALTLFPAFALYGVALLVAPRLLRSHAPAAARRRKDAAA